MTLQNLAVLRVLPFSTLCNAAFALRREVFVWEQKVPAELENDADDLTATHFAAVLDGEIVGTLRMIAKTEHTKIGRVAVHRLWRGKGIAKAMMETAMAYARAAGQTKFYLTAQTDKLAVYEKLGFVAFGDEFEDAGIQHRAMRNYEV